jgi:hypothetical protein
MQDRPGSARYPVVFRSGSGAATSGAVVLGPEHVSFVGGAGEGRVELTVAYSAIVEVRIGRSAEERLDGRPALVLVPTHAPAILVQPLGLGLLHELTNLLADLTAEHAGRSEEVAVIVPLKPGRLERAKGLIADGPPFDPAVLGLERHRVYISERQAVFVFTGPKMRARLEQVTHDPTLWRAGLAWAACIAGRPSLSTSPEALSGVGGEPVYDWKAAAEGP